MKFKQYDINKLRADAVPFFASLIFGLAAHMFMMTNKIPMDDDICDFFNKGATTVSGRWGLEILRLVMPDVSMPWIYGIMTVLILAVSTCVIVRMFGIRSRTLQALTAGIFVTFPAQTGTMAYMFTCAPYALALLMAISAVYIFESRCRLRIVISSLLLIFSCAIYQGYFAFAASFCVLIMIKELMQGNKSAKEVFLHGCGMLCILVISVAVYGLTVIIAGRLAGVPVLDVANKEQGIIMRIAVAYSAYLHTIFDGYFAYVNSGLSLAMHLVLIAITAIGIVFTVKKVWDIKRAVLLAVCLFLLPLSCYCLYMLADNGYIHSLALFPFASIYVLAALVIEKYMPERLNIGRWIAAAAMAVIMLGNIYFANSFYLYGYLQYENRFAFYTAMMTRVMQNESFGKDSSLALVGIGGTLDYDISNHFSFDKFQLPGNNIMKPVHAKDIINNYLGWDIAFADEQTCAEIAQSAEYAEMPVYPYYGSINEIDGYIVVKLG